LADEIFGEFRNGNGGKQDTFTKMHVGISDNHSVQRGRNSFALEIAVRYPAPLTPVKRGRLMGSNDVIILDSTLAQKKTSTSATVPDDSYFEIFSIEQILKNYDLSYEEVMGGLTGGGGDGGIDGFFVFVDGELLDEDTDLAKYKKNPILEIFLIQAKTPSTFSEKAFDTAYTTVANLFELGKPLSELTKLYNPALLEKTETFRCSYVTLAARHPEISVTFAYATKGDTNEIHPNVRTKANQLCDLFSKLLLGCKPRVDFWGAREILESANKEKTYTLQLKLVETPISTGERGYIALANLKDYWEFVTDSGTLRKYIFESNVRDWQGDVEVNQEIRQTLEHQDSLNFWWLNNGITVLCSKATLAGKTMSMDDVQVVNGLQTTVTIHEYLRENPKAEEKRSLLVRVIETEDPEARDRIIKATNHQTSIPPASLKATDRIQRDMEIYFKQNGWYYDRRKNYYKNMGMPLDKIIGIPYLAQAVMTVLLREPDNARARPSTLIKNEGDYKRVFAEAIGFDVYLFCVRLMKAVEERIRIEHLEIPADLKRNLRFHFAAAYVALAHGSTMYKPTDIKDLVGQKINDQLIDSSVDAIVEAFVGYQEVRDWPIDRLTKSREFREEIFRHLEAKITGHEKPVEEKLI
jgi:hypothetical protein